jgi:hypothetical protein
MDENLFNIHVERLNMKILTLKLPRWPALAEARCVAGLPVSWGSSECQRAGPGCCDGS